jgi:hypothetical protein
VDLSGQVPIVMGSGRGPRLAYAHEPAGVWPETFAPSLQTVGQQLPKEHS